MGTEVTDFRYLLSSGATHALYIGVACLKPSLVVCALLGNPWRNGNEAHSPPNRQRHSNLGATAQKFSTRSILCMVATVLFVAAALL